MQIRDLIPWARKDAAPQAKGEEEHPIALLQRDMNRVFDSFWSRFEQSLGGLDLPFGSSGARSDVVETADGVEVSIELPGMEQKDIEVSLTDDALTIKGEKKVERQEEKKGYFMSERSYGSVHRMIPLPPGVDTAKAEAIFKDGVLTVKMPQTAEAKAKVKKIDVKAA
ncbi:MAG: Hsp20/alpha crystallin family protein [Rhodospirillaceae bacterium]|nr:Hsp20/alpha crystallin family protein [Rhodospirillaceae bacterium]